MALSASTSYIWDCRTGFLGKGGTCDVWKARNKKTGRAVAVKVVHQCPAHFRSILPHRREVDVMRQLKHPNIVQFIAVEKELSTGRDVLIMELCQGGSLQKILYEPQNAFGLAEDEFLMVFKHVGGGLQYLRQVGIVHRDLKPGNIMRSIAEDGSSVYKLTDFGTARELSEDDSFMSICGTEEYLHPDIYAVALMHTPHEKKFSARVDLWSLGVTLYHAASGDLPFKPYGGRKNRETMYTILSEKKVGIISGIQKMRNDPIVWADSLPQTCHLSRGLQQELTPMLAGLLELDPQYAWTFDQFFSAMQRVSTSTMVHIYNVAQMALLYLYLPASGCLTEEITRQTGIPAPDQILLYEGELLRSGKSLPCTTPKMPLFLLSTSPQQTPSFNCDFHLPPLAKEEGGDVIRDLASTELYRTTSTDLERHVRDAALKLQLTDTALRMFIQVTKRETEAHLKDTSQLRSSVQDTLLQVQNFLSVDVEMYTKLLEHFLAASPQSNTTIQACMMHARECADSIQCTHNKLEQVGGEDWIMLDVSCLETVWQRRDNRPAHRWQEIVGVRCRQIEDFYQFAKPLREKSRLDYNEKCIYQFERTQVEEHCRKLLEVAQECLDRELPSVLQEAEQAIQSVLAVRAAVAEDRKTMDAVLEAQGKISQLLQQTHLKWISETDILVELTAVVDTVDKGTQTGLTLVSDLPVVSDDAPAVSEDNQNLLQNLMSSLQSFEEQSHKLRLGGIVDETHQLIQIFQRTAASLLTSEALSSMSPDNYDSLTSNVFMSLCVSDSITNTSLSPDCLSVQSETSALRGAVVDTNDVTVDVKPVIVT